MTTMLDVVAAGMALASILPQTKYLERFAASNRQAIAAAAGSALVLGIDVDEIFRRIESLPLAIGQAEIDSIWKAQP